MSGEIKFMKILDSHLSKFQGIIKNRQNLESFDIHYKKHLKTTASCTDIRKFMTLKVVKHSKPIRYILSSTKTITIYVWRNY